MYRKRRFAKMYSDYADDIYRFLYVRLQDKMLAEDMTADTFIKAWQKLGSFDFKHPRGWLYKIASNRLTDHWRGHHSVPLPEDFEAEDGREPVEIEIDRELAQEKLERSLTKLPNEMRSVVTLRFMLGYSARQTGEALGMSEGNVRIIQFRALKKLKGLLK